MRALIAAVPMLPDLARYVSAWAALLIAEELAIRHIQSIGRQYGRGKPPYRMPTHPPTQANAPRE